MGSIFDGRTSGVLVHPTSLPGPFGAGDLGPTAHGFLEFLARAGQSWWQMLPVGPPGAGNSPYNSASTFAGSPALVSLELLARDGLLRADEIAAPRSLARGRAHLSDTARFRDPRLRRAFMRFAGRADPADQRRLDAFRARSATWLPDYALFSALKRAQRGAPWVRWERPLRLRHVRAMERARRRLADEIAFHEFVQMAFDDQWRELRQRAVEHGVRLLGDVPMFVAYDGADVWANQGLYFLDAAGQRRVVAGVPPDAFSSTGQLWGNPLYRWRVMEQRGFDWWIARLSAVLARFDAVRLDHFIGFRRYWEVPAGARSATRGRFVRVPGEALFDRVRSALGALPFVAEDLGIVTDEVRALRDRFDLPGMRVLQFAFDSDEPNEYLPHRYPRHSVVYTGTHDNDTTASWVQARGPIGAARRARLQRYLGGLGPEPWWDMVRLALASVSDTAIFPLQDLLGLGNRGRMNVPGTRRGNWDWRFGAEQLSSSVAERMAGLCETYERLPPRRSAARG